MGCFGFVSSVGSVLRSSRGGLCLNGSENGKGGDVYVERRQRRVRLAMVFEEPKTASSDGGVEDKTDGAGVEQGSNVQKHEEETTALSQEEKLEKARAKKAEAERLEAMAEKARSVKWIENIGALKISGEGRSRKRELLESWKLER